MRKFVAALIALSIAAMAAPMAAEAKTKKKRAQPYAAKAYSAPRNDSYQEYIAEKAPIRLRELVAPDGPRGSRRPEPDQLTAGTAVIPASAERVRESNPNLGC